MAQPRRQLLLIALALAAWGLSACDKAAAPQPFTAVDITGAEYARGFDLPDVDGRKRSLADFKGQVVVVFFGYTQCPDVCPTTMQELAEVKKALGDKGARVQGIFITIDPERDTPAVLKAYMDNFGAGFVALRGTPDETQQVAKQFKVFYAKAPGSTPGSYTMDHTAGSYVFDGQGKVRLFTRYGSGAQNLKHDLGLLLG